MKRSIFYTLFLTTFIFGQESSEEQNQNGSIEEVLVSVSFIPDEKRDTSEISSTLSSESMSIAGDSELLLTHQLEY